MWCNPSFYDVSSPNWQRLFRCWITCFMILSAPVRNSQRTRCLPFLLSHFTSTIFFSEISLMRLVDLFTNFFFRTHWRYWYHCDGLPANSSFAHSGRANLCHCNCGLNVRYMYAILYANESIGISFTMNFTFECAILHDWNAHVTFLVKDRNVMCRIRSLTLSV